MKVTGLPASVPDAAVRVLGPAVVPSVQEVTAAIPLAFLATGVVGLAVPPPRRPQRSLRRAPKSREAALRYYDDFYKTIGDSRAIKREFLQACGNRS